MNLVDNPYTSLSGQDMAHAEHGRPHVEEAREQFSPHMEGVVGDQTEEDAITSSEGEQEVPNEQGPVVIYIRGARKHADDVDAFFRNNGRSIQRFQCDNAEMFTEAVNTDCTRMIVLINEEFSQLMEDEDEFRMCKRAFSDLVGAEKEVQLVNYLDDDDEIVQEVKYTLPRAMRKNIIPYTRFLNYTNGYVALEDHVTSVAQVGDNNHMEVRLEGGNIRAQQVGKSNTFTASSGPSIQGYELTVKTPDTDYELCVEIKKHIDKNIDNINISLKPHNASVESTSLGSVIIRVAVEPGTKLGPVWLREVITKILSEDIIAKLPKGTRMEVSISASLPLTPLDVDIFEFEGENEAAHWMTEYTSDIHRKDETDRSMLHQAARTGNRAAVIINLKLGCPVNDQDCHGNTPLHYAVMSGETGASVSRLLVKGGASIEVVNSDGFTPLHLAVTERNLEMVELFARQFGAKESTPTADQKIEISSLIHFLVKQGADVNALNRTSLTPLQVAASSQGFEVIVALLTEGGDANVVDENGQTPLHQLFGLNKPNQKIDEITVAYRLKKQMRVEPVTQSSGDTCKPDDNGASKAPSSVLDIPDNEGNTPLQSALNSNFTQAAIILLNAGANANTKNKGMDTPLHTVAGNTNIENTITEHDAVVKIIECSRDVNVTDKQGNTPLMLAVKKTTNISPLLKAGADVNAKNIHGDTPLIIAVEHANQIMETLLEAGSEVYTSNTQLLLKAGADVDAPINERQSNPIQLIAAGADVNVQDKDGNTPLMLAVKTGWDISPLLKAGADVNAQNIHGDTSLIIAVKHASQTMETLLEAGSDVCTSNTQLLLKAGADVDAPINERQSNPVQLIAAGADVNVQDKDGNTPLMLAVKTGWDISPLLKAGADVNAQNIHGDTPLVIAVKHDSRMAHGANVNASNTHGRTDPHKAFSLYHSITNVDKMANTPSSTHVAKEAGLFLEAIPSSDDVSSEGETVYELVYTDDIQLSYKHSSVISEVGNVDSEVNVEDGNGNTPMTVAVRHGIVENVEALLKAGADVDAKDPMGRTPLMIAIETSQWISISNKKESNLITKLITLGADVNAEDPFSNTPLMMAVATGWDITLLLKAGADVNSKNGLCKTALHLVSEHLHPQYGHALVNARHRNTKLLIAAGADVNAQDEDGNTPLMMAVATGWDISPLLKAGADVNSKNGLGKTALHLISEHLHDRYKHTLINARHMNTKLLIAAGADVNAQDEDGNTPLMKAVGTGWNISPLLKAGANVTSKNGLGKTALHLVSEHLHDRYKHAHISARHRNTKLLIDAGADVNAQDEDGNTPLMMAVASGWDISPLLKARADVNLKNGLGKTALHLVGEYRHHRYGYAHINERQSNTEQLIAAGADVNAQDEDGNTPFQICLKNNDYRSVKALLSVLRPDVNITNSIGKSAMHLAGDAVSPTHFDIIGNFRKRCSFGLTEYSHEEPKEAIIRAILSRLPDINAQDHIDRTPLNIAKMLGDISLEEPLLSGGITSESEFGSSGARPFYSSTEKKKLKRKKRHKKTWKGRFEGNKDVH